MSGQDPNTVLMRDAMQLKDKLPVRDTLLMQNSAAISDQTFFPDTPDMVLDSDSAALFIDPGITQNPQMLEGGFKLMEGVGSFQHTWLFIYLIVLLGIFAWVRLYYGNILAQTYQAATSFQVASRMYKDNSMLQKQLDNILYGFYFLSIAFLLYLVEQKLELKPYGLSGGILYLFNLVVLMALFFGRIVLVNFAGFLFNRLRMFREYIYNAFIFNKLMGVAVLPLLLFMVYTTGWIQMVFHWAAAVTVSLVILMRIIRGIIFSFKRDVLIFYMFLYLCALEIIPLTLIYKWLDGIL